MGALLDEVRNRYILDIVGVRTHFPLIFRLVRLTGYGVVTRLGGLLCEPEMIAVKLAVILVLISVVPLVVFWSVVFFLFVYVPIMTLFFLRHPLTLSRFWTLLISFAGAIYGLALTLHMLVFLIWPSERAHFAVTWERTDTVTCVCGCVYPVATSIVFRLLIVGMVAGVRSFLVGFRCLKGLRRANWANLLSVTFSVPVAVYNVEWCQENGEPIRHRKEGEPVQGELAFDPFALMDEQPNSASTTVELRPRRYHRMQSIADARDQKGPRIPMSQRDLDQCVDTETHEVIGCCGFPRSTGGIKGRYSTLDFTNIVSDDRGVGETGERQSSVASCSHDVQSIISGQPVVVSESTSQTPEELPSDLDQTANTSDSLHVFKDDNPVTAL